MGSCCIEKATDESLEKILRDDSTWGSGALRIGSRIDGEM